MFFQEHNSENSSLYDMQSIFKTSQLNPCGKQCSIVISVKEQTCTQLHNSFHFHIQCIQYTHIINAYVLMYEVTIQYKSKLSIWMISEFINIFKILSMRNKRGLMMADLKIPLSKGNHKYCIVIP